MRDSGIRIVVLGAVMCLFAPAARPADTTGLDVTIEVLGRNDRIDERIVNRIDVPGVEVEGGKSTGPLPGLGGAIGGTVTGVTDLVDGVVQEVPPLVPLLRYDEWVQQRREAEQQRRGDSR